MRRRKRREEEVRVYTKTGSKVCRANMFSRLQWYYTYLIFSSVVIENFVVNVEKMGCA